MGEQIHIPNDSAAIKSILNELDWSDEVQMSLIAALRRVLESYV